MDPPEQQDEIEEQQYVPLEGTQTPRLRRAQSDATKRTTLRNVLKKFFPEIKNIFTTAKESNDYDDIRKKLRAFVRNEEALNIYPNLDMNNVAEFLGYSQNPMKGTIPFVVALDKFSEGSGTAVEGERGSDELFELYKSLDNKKGSGDVDEVIAKMMGNKESTDILETLEPGSTVVPTPEPGAGAGVEEGKEEGSPPSTEPGEEEETKEGEEEETKEGDDPEVEDPQEEVEQEEAKEEEVGGDMNRNVEMKVERQRETKIDDPPRLRTVDQIPSIRLSDDNKTVIQLRNDIRYFFTNFGEMLKPLRNTYKRIENMNLVQLRRFHRRIVGRLDPKGVNQLSRPGSKTGVVIDADEYIQRRVNEVMIEKAMNQFRPEQLRPVAPTNDDEENKGDNIDVGNYEIKKNRSGILSAQREPIYKYIPQGEKPPDQVSKMRKRERNKVKLPPSKLRNRVTGAKRFIKDDPFTDRVSSRRINLLY